MSDRGSSFTSEEFREFLNESEVQHILIATGSPKANGQVERVNRVLGPMLGKICDEKSGNYWYKVFSDVEYAINNTVSKTTGTTPSKLLFGINQRGKSTDEVKQYVIDANEKDERDLEKTRTEAAKKIVKAQKQCKKQFDKKRKEAHKYKEDDYVMVKNFESTAGAPRKLIPKFKGPYRVVKVLRNDRYILADVENHQVAQRPYQGVWEAANMRPWCANEAT